MANSIENSIGKTNNFGLVSPLEVLFPDQFAGRIAHIVSVLGFDVWVQSPLTSSSWNTMIVRLLFLMTTFTEQLNTADMLYPIVNLPKRRIRKVRFNGQQSPLRG